MTKALEIVKKFEMVWPDRYGNDPSLMTGKKPPIDPLRAPVLTAGERIGLYKGTHQQSGFGDEGIDQADKLPMLGQSRSHNNLLQQSEQLHMTKEVSMTKEEVFGRAGGGLRNESSSFNMGAGLTPVKNSNRNSIREEEPKKDTDFLTEQIQGPPPKRGKFLRRGEGKTASAPGAYQ